MVSRHWPGMIEHQPCFRLFFTFAHAPADVLLVRCSGSPATPELTATAFGACADSAGLLVAIPCERPDGRDVLRRTRPPPDANIPGRINAGQPTRISADQNLARQTSSRRPA